MTVSFCVQLNTLCASWKAYQVLSLAAGNSGQMEHQELQGVAVLRWKHINRLLKVSAALSSVGDACMAVSKCEYAKTNEDLTG